MLHPQPQQLMTAKYFRFRIQRIALCFVFAIVFSCGGHRTNESSAESNEVAMANGEITIETYSIKDAGILTIERRKDSLIFSILVGAGENCTGETSGIAMREDDGSYVYGDSDCHITFKPTDTGMQLAESGDLCDHGAHCSFDGDYAKVATEKVSLAKADVMSWVRKNTNDFTCMLESTYGIKSEKYPCGKNEAVKYDPSSPNWYEGPEFPQEQVKAVHPFVRNIALQFEHGDLQTVTVTLEQKMTLQSVQRIFSLPNPFQGYGNEKYSNVLSLTFDGNSADDKPQFSVNPVFVTAFTLTGFEHMGAGDLEVESETINESTITYEYRETGDTFSLIDEGGPGPYEFTCTSIATVKTSSDLSSQGKVSYSVDNLTDMNETTTWAEGKSGLGEGEWIEFTLTDEYKKWGYTDKDFVSHAIHGGFVIQTGYAKSPALWRKNSRPIKLKCYLNGEFLSIIQLKDVPDFQRFNIYQEGGDLTLEVGDVIRFEILEVIKGTKDEDACISEFHLEGNCG